MSRSSNTRLLTREAAADLVVLGRRPHEITVDLIYAAIRQGSRTTINAELKAWKEEQAQADALGADLPPVVADRMRSLWVVAVEHGERAFEQRRGELEAQLVAASEQLAAAQAAVAQLRSANELVNRQVSTLSQQVTELRNVLGAETAAKTEAVAHAHALQQELTAVRLQSARQLESVRQEQEKQAAEFQQAITLRDTAFRAELDTATQRLESAQAHMLQEIDAARQGQKRAEVHGAKIEQQRNHLQNELAELRMHLGVQTHELDQLRTALQAADQEAARSAAERQALTTDLASTRGRLEGTEATLRALEARAAAAEDRLVEVLSRSDARRTLARRRAARTRTP